MVMLLFRSVALLLITAVVIWALVLGWWQSNDHTPATAEALLYLIALPIALFGGFIFINAFIKSMGSSPAPTKSDAADEQPAVDPAALAREAETRRRQLAILGTAVCTPGAADTAGFIALVREGKTPQPDKQLKDDDGFPAFVARIHDIDEAAVADHLARFNEPGVWPADFSRNIAILERVLVGVLPDIHTLFDAGTSPSLHLRIEWLTDTPMEKIRIDALRQWLLDEHFSAFEPQRLDIQIETTVDPIAAASRIDHLCELSARSENATLTLLVASASKVSEPILRRWQTSGQLFMPDHQQGRIPGEIGAALLLGSPATATALGIENPVLISRPNAHARDKSVDAGGRISAQLCARLCEELLALFAFSPDTIKALVTDCDHRASRQAEALGAIDESYESIDVSQDFLAVGTASGSADPAAALLMFACAAELVGEVDGPVLALSVQHPTQRAALLLAPSPKVASQPSPD